MEVEVLKHELKLVVKVATKIVGVHTRVAEKVGISAKYSELIRKDKRCKLETEDNVLLIKSLIKEYRKEINNYEREIKQLKAN